MNPMGKKEYRNRSRVILADKMITNTCFAKQAWRVENDNNTPMMY